MLRHWFEQPWRGGFVESLWQLIGLDWAVPEFSTLSRRQKTPKVNIPYRGLDGPLHLLTDSTGIRVEGDGASMAARSAGSGARSTSGGGGAANNPGDCFPDEHEKTLEIRAAEFTTSGLGDAPMPPELLDQIPPGQEIGSVTADGAFDTRKCHDAIAAGGAAAMSGILLNQWRSCHHPAP